MGAADQITSGKGPIVLSHAAVIFTRLNGIRDKRITRDKTNDISSATVLEMRGCVLKCLVCIPNSILAQPAVAWWAERLSN